MLALSRYPREGIIIGEDIAVVVVKVEPHKGNKVRLGILAPREIEVYRHEIFRDRFELPPNVDDAAELVDLHRAIRQGKAHSRLSDRLPAR